MSGNTQVHDALVNRIKGNRPKPMTFLPGIYKKSTAAQDLLTRGIQGNTLKLLLDSMLWHMPQRYHPVPSCAQQSIVCGMKSHAAGALVNNATVELFSLQEVKCS